ncbi:hypothetical protein HYDPIDRAFT_86062 [Hydnomerulius pinastri MD-312]|nr:hypothetical protein HYDPIDRAFT_86062 [Hydnomerulius pinastri MD-312]
MRLGRQYDFPLPLPPGPLGLPLVGSALRINAAKPWLTFQAWKATYGDICYARLFHRDVIIINSTAVARSLLDLRSNNYSDRPHSGAYEAFGLDFNSVIFPYGNKWRIHRRLMHQTFRPGACESYQPLQLRQARRLALGLLEAPIEYPSHLHMHSICIIMHVVYGYQPSSTTDPLVELVDKANALAIEAASLGNTMTAETFPFLLELPPRFPGAQLKRTALLCKELFNEMIDAPYEYVKHRMNIGLAAPSMVSEALSNAHRDNHSVVHEIDIKQAAATAYSCELTASVMHNFLLAMALNPKIQDKAYERIAQVVGTDRLPDFSDRASLPYLDAIFRETLRWHPVVPLAVPHAATKGDVYNGYYIPEGATVIANTWAMSRDESTYPNPSAFVPERFLTISESKLTEDTVHFAWGWGRRVCVGKHLADASVWSAMATILAVLKIVPAMDEMGREVIIKPEWTAGLTSHPLQFPCAFVLRTPSMALDRLAGDTELCD